MANTYVATPAVIPGALTINGDLSVNGNVRAGVSPRIVRMGVFPNSPAGGLSTNLGFDGATRDDTGQNASLMLPPGGGGSPRDKILNASGTSMDRMRQHMLGNDGTQRVNTGNITENTIYTRTIPGGNMGGFGGFCLELIHQLTVNTAGGVNLRIYFGGTLIFTQLLNVVATDIWRIYAIQQGLTNSCGFYGSRVRSDGTVTMATGVTAVDSAGDRILLVTLQNVTASNSSQINLFRVTDHIGDFLL